MHLSQNTAQSLPYAIIIEDDAAISMILKTVLTQEGYKVKIIHNGRQAFDYLQTVALQNVAPHLLLLDLGLPGVPGAKILQALTQIEHYQNTYIFLITAHAKLGQGLADSVEGIMEKPIRIKALRELAAKYKSKFEVQSSRVVRDP